MGKLPFEGIRVADFGWILAAPLSGQWLSTLGADVIRIESKARPDLVRMGAAGGVVPGLSLRGTGWRPSTPSTTARRAVPWT